jgi:CHAD domain-containing protein
MAGITLPGIEKACPVEAGLVPLRVAAQDQARERRRQAAVALNSQRYSRLLLALGHWMQTTHTRESIPAAQQAALAAPLEQSAARMLKRWHAKLLKRGNGLQSLSPEARHQVRIVAKRVRYAAEFFSSLYPLRRMRPYVKTLVALQDELGRLNDAEVAAGLLRHLAQADTGFAESAGFVNGYLSSSALQGVRKLGKRWRAFQRGERPQTK